MHVESIRLFVSMDTVWHHMLISLKMVKDVKVFIDLSENVIHGSGKEIKLGQRDGHSYRYV